MRSALPSTLKIATPLKPLGSTGLSSWPDEEDFDRPVLRDEFGMVWAGIDDTPPMLAFRAVCMGRQRGQQGNGEDENSKLHA